MNDGFTMTALKAKPGNSLQQIAKYCYGNKNLYD